MEICVCCCVPRCGYPIRIHMRLMLVVLLRLRNGDACPECLLALIQSASAVIPGCGCQLFALMNLACQIRSAVACDTIQSAVTQLCSDLQPLGFWGAY